MCFCRFQDSNDDRRKKYLMSRLEEINQAIVDDYDNFYENYDDYYEEKKDYSSHFNKPIYSGNPDIYDNFEKYKNMFDTENPDHSRETVDDTIDQFNDWVFERKSFGKDLSSMSKTRLEAGRSKPIHYPEFDSKQRDIQRSFNQNMQDIYRTNSDMDGRSISSDEYINNSQRQSESINIPYYLILNQTKHNFQDQSKQNKDKNILPMKMNNNNLKVEID